MFGPDGFNVVGSSFQMFGPDGLNHFSTTGRCSGPANYDVSVRQAARAAFVTSSFKIFLTQTFPRPVIYCLRGG